MRPSRVVDVVRAGPSRSRASIVAIMAKVNRRAKVPKQNANRRPSTRAKGLSVVDGPWSVGRIRAHIRAGGHEPGEDQDEASHRCRRDPVRGLAALSLAGILATTSRNAGSLRGIRSLQQSTNSGIRTFFFSKRRKNKSDRNSRGSGDAGVGHRMHSGRAKHCRGHHRSDEPLRPIGDAGRRLRLAIQTFTGRRHSMPPSRSPRAVAHPAGRRNYALPPGRA
jgi:hypothetical protein